MTAMITAAVIGVAGSNMAASRSADAQRRAADRIDSAEGRAMAEQRRQYNQTREDWAPWRATGTNALSNIDAVNSGDMSAFHKSPGYQFRLDEGTRNNENLFSMKGGGGNAMRALAEYGQNFASNEFGNWYNRQLAGAGLGTQGTAQTQQAGQNMANNNSNSMWRGAEDQATIGMFGAQQQAGYMSDGLGALMSGIKGYANRGGGGGSSSGGYSPNYFLGNQTDQQMMDGYDFNNVPRTW